MESLLLGTALGLFAGIIPGPFLALVATTALKHGLEEAFKVALVPLLTETPVLLLSVFVLSRLSQGWLQWIGVAGGLLILYMAWRVVREARDVDPTEGAGPDPRGHFWRVVAVGLLSPSPWVFWFLIAGPLLINRWLVGWIHGVVFLVSFFACFVGMMILVAWAVATGRRRLSDVWYHRSLRIAGAVLAIGGSVLIWQAFVGNFEEMIRPQEAIRESIHNAGR